MMLEGAGARRRIPQSREFSIYGLSVQNRWTPHQTSFQTQGRGGDYTECPAIYSLNQGGRRAEKKAPDFSGASKIGLQLRYYALGAASRTSLDT